MAIFSTGYTEKSEAENADFVLITDTSASNAVKKVKAQNVLPDASVISDKLASDSVTTAKILNSNVTTAKIADGNVTASKIDHSSYSTPVWHDFGGTTNRTRTSATAALISGASAQAFTSLTGKVKVTISAPISTNTETGNVGVFKSDTSTYTVIISTNSTARDSITASRIFTVTPGVSINYSPYFASQSGSSTVTIWPFSTATMIVEDVL